MDETYVPFRNFIIPRFVFFIDGRGYDQLFSKLLVIGALRQIISLYNDASTCNYSLLAIYNLSG